MQSSEERIQAIEEFKDQTLAFLKEYKDVFTYWVQIRKDCMSLPSYN